jgi:putative heme-binding domain-containing protein
MMTHQYNPAPDSYNGTTGMSRSQPIILLAAVLAASVQAIAQESSATLQNPFTSDADIAAGEKLYLGQCASCHGRDGRGGGAGPDISTGNFKRATSDEGLFQIVNKGIPGTVMPGSPFNAGQVWRIVAFVRSLTIGRGNKDLEGDAAIGARLYSSLGCGKCHSGMAPDLQGIGARRTRPELRTSIEDPHADVPSTYWRVRATMRDGSTVSGTAMNEDTFSIQLLDAAGRLRSLHRANVTKLVYDRTSPMPPFRLSANQFDDLIAFLTSEVGR